MSIPFVPILFGYPINVHLVLEYLAFFIAFRYYVFLRKSSDDAISRSNRLSILIGAIVGAVIGSRLVGYFENPVPIASVKQVLVLLNVKTIMGGLFGGLLGVELAKKIIGEKHSSGDLFTLPLVLGIFIGRIGCFLMGTKEFTYGEETNFITGMNLGDGVNRHPLALYEMVYLFILFFSLRRIQPLIVNNSGLLFKVFMLLYFAFRFFIEFLKPNFFYIGGLSSIQWLCIICWLYYVNTLLFILKHAYKKLHLLRLHS